MAHVNVVSMVGFVEPGCDTVLSSTAVASAASDINLDNNSDTVVTTVTDTPAIFSDGFGTGDLSGWFGW